MFITLLFLLLSLSTLYMNGLYNNFILGCND
jgi:hypothetical protein